MYDAVSRSKICPAGAGLIANQKSKK